jgi:hypothetical protein
MECSVSFPSDSPATVLMDHEIEFEVRTPLGFVVRCTSDYWLVVSTMKHPVMRGKRADVIDALREPDEVRRSRKDAEVLLFYRAGGPRWHCVVVRQRGAVGYLITAYPTDSMKVGEVLWTRSE